MKNNNISVIVGAQWGDEGKGKIVDLLAENAELIVRYGGGANAGHTLVVGGQKIILHLIPSAAMYPGKFLVLGNNMVICPETLWQEFTELTKLGLLKNSFDFFRISGLAHIVMPYHIALDGLREAASGGDIGTTKRGIGPTYESKAARVGIRMGHLHDDPQSFAQRVNKALKKVNPEIRELGGQCFTVDDMVQFLMKARNNLYPYIRNINELVFNACMAGKNILLEGAQGTALDVDHGTYPYVTSSSTLSGAACSGSGLGPTTIGNVIGVTKAYATRVGGGPFPTEIKGDLGDQLRAVGQEYGATTGRPRKVGWIDLVQLRYAAQINGLTGLAITKLDVLRGIHPVMLCTRYDQPPRFANNMGNVSTDAMSSVTPGYFRLNGFDEDISNVRWFADLPDGAKDIVNMICQEVNVPPALISVGPERDQTIWLMKK